MARKICAGYPNRNKRKINFVEPMLERITHPRIKSLNAWDTHISANEFEMGKARGSESKKHTRTRTGYRLPTGLI
jgi:hypothetical protein